MEKPKLYQTSAGTKRTSVRFVKDTAISYEEAEHRLARAERRIDQAYINMPIQAKNDVPKPTPFSPFLPTIEQISVKLSIFNTNSFQHIEEVLALGAPAIQSDDMTQRHITS